jgi:hypothetical protein
MRSTRLEAAVARATGESVREIRHRGFGLVDETDVDIEAESCDVAPQVVNWDDLARRRVSLFP